MSYALFTANIGGRLLPALLTALGLRSQPAALTGNALCPPFLGQWIGSHFIHHLLEVLVCVLKVAEEVELPIWHLLPVDEVVLNIALLDPGQHAGPDRAVQSFLVAEPILFYAHEHCAAFDGMSSRAKEFSLTTESYGIPHVRQDERRYGTELA